MNWNTQGRRSTSGISQANLFASPVTTFEQKLIVRLRSYNRIRPLYVFEKTVATFGTFALLYTITENFILPLVPTSRQQSFWRSLLDLALPFMVAYLLLFYIIFGKSYQLDCLMLLGQYNLVLMSCHLQNVYAMDLLSCPGKTSCLYCPKLVFDLCLCKLQLRRSTVLRRLVELDLVG